jgi:hypothetical protein
MACAAPAHNLFGRNRALEGSLTSALLLWQYIEERMRTLSAKIGFGASLLFVSGVGFTRPLVVQATAEKSAPSGKSKDAGLPAGTAKIWEDRGELTPAKVYWGAHGLLSDPLSRLPAPPFSHFKLDVDGKATTPKAKLADSKGVEWTAKFGEEIHSDTVAPRLAWALGFGAVEGYYVDKGTIQGIEANTNLGILKDIIQPNGTFTSGARFKRHNKDDDPVQDEKGEDKTWDEAHNPGVPPEQLSGLLIFEVMVGNWDTQQKNCKIYHTTGPNGPENWYIVSDLGATFSGGPKKKFVLADYQKDPSFINSISKDDVNLKFDSVIKSQGRIHQKIPLAHGQWFRKQLVRLTDDEIQAAFDAGFATEGLNKAYATGDPVQIKAAREKELPQQTRADITAFVATFRAKIAEFLQKVPAGPSGA